MRNIPVFCGKDCGGDCCPLLATVEDGVVTGVTNNPASGEFMTGCRRGFSLPLELYARERLLKPLIRRGDRGSGDFRETSWDEALDLVAGRLAEVRARYGAASVLNLGSAGSTSAFHNTKALLSRFLNISGGATDLWGSYSNGAAKFVLPYLLGSGWQRSGFDAATMGHSEMIILWGANVLEARLGTEVDLRLREAKKRGAEIVVVDPRRTETARRVDAWWVPCRPGTDAALMLAVLHVLFTEGFADRSCMTRLASGFDRLEARVLGGDGGPACTPEWAAGICGLPPEGIRRFARAYGSARPALLFPGYSIQRVQAGEENYRLAVALQIATGNFGLLGGSTGSMNNRLPKPRVGTLPVPEGADRLLVPTVRWPDAVLEGKRGGYPSDLRAIYSAGGNLLNQGADVPKNIRAFKAVEFSVCHDLFLTPTARWCDVVLPAAHTLEREDIGVPWDGNFITYKAAAVPPRGGTRTDYEIFSGLADRMGFRAAYTEGRDAAAWIQSFLDESEVTDRAEFMRTGVYFGRDRERTGLADFAADPEGNPLDTPSGKVEIASDLYARETGMPAVPGYLRPPEDPRYPLLLVTPKSPRRTHSQGFGIAEIRRRSSHALEMNPQDATERGIGDGGRVRIWNDRGSSVLPVRLSPNIMPGVVSLPEGAWADLDGRGLDGAGSANMFTSTEGTVPGIAPVMHGIGVEVETF
jgi:anaerobic dimethyl sulfoxide reductase subunit A